MRRTVQHIVSSVFGLVNGVCNARQGDCILMYHAVGTPIADDRRGLYTISPSMFETHMQYLAANHTTSLRSLSIDMLNQSGGRVVITFDDGYADNLYVARPILEKLEIPFTVFVIAGAVASGTSGFLAPGELRELACSPFAQIGSHGMTHRRLSECNDSDLKMELQDSKRYLEDMLGKEVNYLSYPHGSVDERVVDFAREAGYTLGASSRFSLNRSGFNPLMLSRTDIWADDTSEILKDKIAGDWDWLKWR